MLLEYYCNFLIVALSILKLWKLSALSIFAFVLLALLLKVEGLCHKETEELAETSSLAKEDDGKANRKKIASGVFLSLLVILMACIFSTLDNAVTIHHAMGTDMAVAAAFVGGEWFGCRLSL